MKFLSILDSRVELTGRSAKRHKDNGLDFSLDNEKRAILIASIVINFLALAFPLLMLQLYDRILPHQSLDTMSIFAVAVCTAVALEAVTRVMRSYLTAWIAAKFEHKTMMALAERVLSAPLPEFEHRGLGPAMENFKSISTLKSHYSGQTFQQLMDLPFAVIYLLIIFALNIWIGLLLSVSYAIYIYIVWKVCANDLVLLKNKKMADLRRNNFLNETLNNVHTLKSMSMESLKLRQFENLQENSARNMAQMSYSIDMASGIGNVFSPLLTTLMVSLGAWLVINHQLTNGELAACVLLGMRSLAPIQRLGGIWSKFLQDRLLRSKLAKVLSTANFDSDAVSDTDKKDQKYAQDEHQMSSLDLTDISFKYPGTKLPIFESINLNISAGECIAISGLNGSGRSTLLQIMAGILPPNKGSVQLSGKDLSNIRAGELSKRISYLPQNGQIFEGSLLDNVSAFDETRVEKALELAQIMGLSEFVSRMPRGWDSPVGDMATEALPTGYCQRIAMIRALSNESDIVLVDDPTATVDSEGDAKFLRYLESIRGKVTLVIVSQRLVYLRLATRNLFLSDGRLIELEPDQIASISGAFESKNNDIDKAQSLGTYALKSSSGLYQSIIAAEYFNSTNSRDSLELKKWERVQETIDSLMKIKTDLSSCLTPLLKHLNARTSAREIAEALPNMTNQLDLSGFQNTMAQLGYKARQVRCRLGEIESRSLPCLFLPDAGLAFVAIGRHGQNMRKSVSKLTEIDLENDLNILGCAYFYELVDPKLIENRSWVTRVMLRFTSLIGQAILSALVTGLVVMTGPLFMMMVYSTIIPSGATDTLFYLAVGSILSLASAYFFMKQRAQILSYIAGRIEYLFGSKILEQIFRMPPAYTERVSVGSQLSKLQSFEAFRDLFTGPLASTLLELPATIVLLIALSIINPAALLIFVAMASVYIFLYWIFSIPIRIRVSELSQASSRRNQFLVEMISKMRTVRESNAQSLWFERFRDISASATIAGFKAEKLSMMLVGTSYFVMMIASLLIVVVTVPMVFSQTVTSGALIASMMLMGRVLTPIQTFFTNMSSIERVRASALQIDNLMRIQGETQNAATSMINREHTGQIEFSRVSFRYSMNADPALIGLEFKISPGELIAISGPNGGGKSTVLKMILGMYQPQAGAILIDNIDIRQIVPVELRRMIGYAPQDVQLFKATIAQNLRLAHPDSSDEQIYQALDIAGGLDQVLALPGGLNYRLGENSSQLSNSLRQKISLARCYLTRAPIMLFDEPDTGLDEIGGRKFIEAMRALKGKSTVIFISHKPSHILLADTLMVFDKGYLRAAGPPGELLKNPVEA